MTKKAKSKAAVQRRRMIFACVAAVIVLMIGLFAASRTFAQVRLSNLADVFTSFSVKDDSTFPYAVDSAAVVRIAPVGSGIAVLRADKLDILTKSGAVLQSVPHTYTTPAIDVCAGRTLLYDRGGTRYRLLSKTGVLIAESEASSDILTAALSSDGRYAVATTAEGAKSLLTVYTSKGEKLFQYKCMGEYVTDIAFTQKGVALTVAGVENAETHSRLLLLHFKKTEPLADLVYADTTFFRVCSDGRTVTACSRDKLVRVDGKLRQQETAFESDTLQYYCADAYGKATLVLLTYGNEHATHLLGLHKNGATAFDTQCGEKIKAASRSDSYTSVLTDNAVLTYNNSGSQVGALTLLEPAQDICLSDRTAFVLFPDRIESFPAAGTHTQKAAE